MRTSRVGRRVSGRGIRGSRSAATHNGPEKNYEGREDVPKGPPGTQRKKGHIEHHARPQVEFSKRPFRSRHHVSLGQAMREKCDALMSEPAPVVFNPAMLFGIERQLAPRPDREEILLEKGEPDA